VKETAAQSDYLYRALADDLASQIGDGVYRDGERLPSIRTLHRERGVSISTVSQALVELERRGLVQARPRSGYFVSQSTMDTPAVTRHRVRPRRVPLPHLADDFVTASANATMVPLGGAVLGASLLPLKHLARLTREAASDGAASFASYGPPAGSPVLRRLIAKRMLALGLAVNADEVVISSGCMDAIRLALLACARPGDVVALESPTFFGFLQAVRDLGLYALEIPTDPQLGLDVDAFERALTRHRVQAAIVTPTFHNPTGATMPDAAKRRVAELCARHRVTVIEDDVYGDLTHVEPRPRPLAALSKRGDVIYTSSFSKTLAPGLRIGWLLPGKHLDRVRRLKLSGTIASPALNQQVLGEYLSSGAYERHLRRLRGKLRHSTTATRLCLAQQLPEDCRVTSPSGGFLLWLRLPKGTDAHALYERAHAEGISILPGTLCATDRKYGDCIRINAANPFDATIEEAIERLASWL
jgi:DNA-binding transcriptional MocR family regulator